MNGRSWTASEDQRLRMWYRKRPISWIEARLNRSRRAIYSRADTIGLTERRFEITGQVREILREKNAEGWSDTEIDRHLRSEHGIKIDRHTLGEVRRQMGLENNSQSLRQRQKTRETTARQCQAAGVANLGELRSHAYRKFARRHGWPETLTVRAVMVAELLYRRGPTTRLQICAALGIAPKKRSSPHSNAKGGTVMAELERAGIVLSLPRAVKGKGKGKSVTLYMIQPGVQPNEPTT